MNIRKFFSLSCLTVMGLFWASCGDDSNSQGPDNTPDPESSSGTKSAEPESSAGPESSSSDVAQSSSSDDAQSSSSDAGGLMGDERVKLSRDTSVTCTVKHSLGNEDRKSVV